MVTIPLRNPVPADAIRALFKNVTKRFGARPVFENLSLKLKRGGRYGLLGPNGAGKTTLMRLMYGALCPDDGEVLVDGLVPWRETWAVLARLGVLAENAPLVPELTPQEHLKLAASLRGLSSKDFSGECERLSSALNLSAFLKCPAGALSMGQRRRAALAAAFMGQPDFLILDEPTSGLDPDEAAHLRNLLSDLPSSATLLISSHILSEVFDLTSEIIVLAGGRLKAQGPWVDFLDVRENPGESVLRASYLKLTESGPEAGQ
ncbi:ABC transporter [Deltaproteobacteria bacterium Smac51]|nr:ABC transporter [Deltaproteobacteria bacterium Smac51]